MSVAAQNTLLKAYINTLTNLHCRLPIPAMSAYMPIEFKFLINPESIQTILKY